MIEIRYVTLDGISMPDKWTTNIPPREIRRPCRMKIPGYRLPEPPIQEVMMKVRTYEYRGRDASGRYEYHEVEG